MFSMLKKTVIAAALVITFAVAASPVDYLSPESDVCAYVNVSSLLNVTAMQQFIPMIESELQSSGMKLKDFEGELAIGLNLSTSGKDVQVNIDAVIELKKAIAKRLFNLAKASEKESKSSFIAGRPAFSSKDGRMILQTSNVLIAQFQAEGKKPLNVLTKSGNNPLKKVAKQIQQFDIVLYADVEQLMKKMQAAIPADDKDVAEIASKISKAFLFSKFMQGEKTYLNLSVFCKTAKDAETIAAYAKVFIDTAARENNELKTVLNKIKNKIEGTRVSYEITLDKNDINMFMQLAK